MLTGNYSKDRLKKLSFEYISRGPPADKSACFALAAYSGLPRRLQRINRCTSQKPLSSCQRPLAISGVSPCTRTMGNLPYPRRPVNRGCPPGCARCARSEGTGPVLSLLRERIDAVVPGHQGPQRTRQHGAGYVARALRLDPGAPEAPCVEQFRNWRGAVPQIVYTPRFPVLNRSTREIVVRHACRFAPCLAHKKKGPSDRALQKISPAVTYSPTRSPGQYHRRWKA